MPGEYGDDDKKDGLNFVKNGDVYIYGVFDDSIAKSVIPDLVKEIEAKKSKRDAKISFFIDSNGGETRYLFNLLALVEMAKAAGITIETNVFGHAYSCGSLLAAAGTKGHRRISWLAEHLCHLGSASTGVVVNEVELSRGAERVASHFERVRTLYKKYANLENLEDAIKFDNHFIRGEAIIKNGLADSFVD
jgi:ATP-dependent protease ClpP protease subunit